MQQGNIAAKQRSSRAAKQQGNIATKQQSGKTAKQQSSKTAKQQNSKATKQQSSEASDGGKCVSETIEAVEASFRQLVMAKPYRSITVKEICEGAYISRRTFYANFIDKRAVMASILRRDSLDAVRRIVELLGGEEALSLSSDIIRRFYEGIWNNREFYASLVKPMRWADPTFTRVVVRAVEKLLADIVKKYNPHADEALVSYCSTYHASALANTLEAWIYEGYETPIETLVACHASVLVPSLAALVRGDCQ